MIAPAPSLPPVSLEAAFVSALAAAPMPPADPIEVLARPGATPKEKLAAIEEIHRSMPHVPQERRTKGLDALREAASSPRETPGVRALALTYLGYAVPVVGDEKAREAAVNALLDATAAPAYRVFALRGLGPATHHLPPSTEDRFQKTILRLLAGPLNEEERVTALVGLDGFVREREDFARRRPDLVNALDRAILVPLEADPAAFAASFTPNARSLVIAVVWHSARNRFAAGDPAALARVNALLRTLLALEKDASVRSEIESFLAAPDPKALP